MQELCALSEGHGALSHCIRIENFLLKLKDKNNLPHLIKWTSYTLTLSPNLISDYNNTDGKKCILMIVISNTCWNAEIHFDFSKKNTIISHDNKHI